MVQSIGVFGAGCAGVRGGTGASAPQHMDDINRGQSTSFVSVQQDDVAELMSALSHDIRTPLTCIKGYLSLLNEGRHAPGSPEWRELYELIMDECSRLEKLISAVLDSAADEHRLKLSCEPVLLPAMVTQVLKGEYFISRGHRFVVCIAPEVRVVRADPVRLEQVIRNLLDNAVKYSPDGSLVVLKVTRKADEVVFSVADQGVGIAPEHLNRLFDRFYRVRDRVNGRVSGTGLGLAIARRIVEAHGGKIWAESTPGRGSTFYFTLPAVEFETPLESDQGERPENGSTGRG